MPATQDYQLPAEEGRADYIRRNFDAIAANYDRFNDWITFGMHRLWKRSVVRATGLAGRPGARALDLCSGSGDIALLLARRLGPGSGILALDFSRGMLDVLERRLHQQKPAGAVSENASGASNSGGARVETLEGDASDLSRFPEASFDAVTIGFGLRNVQDRERCLAECLRVLRPGARLVILDVGQVRWKIPAFFHRVFFEKVAPKIGHLLQGEQHEMYDYLPASAKIYPDQDKLKAMLEATGFAPVRYSNRLLGSAVIHVAEKPTA